MRRAGRCHRARWRRRADQGRRQRGPPGRGRAATRSVCEAPLQVGLDGAWVDAEGGGDRRPRRNRRGSAGRRRGAASPGAPGGRRRAPVASAVGVVGSTATTRPRAAASSRRSITVAGTGQAAADPVEGEVDRDPEHPGVGGGMPPHRRPPVVGPGEGLGSQALGVAPGADDAAGGRDGTRPHRPEEVVEVVGRSRRPHRPHRSPERRACPARTRLGDFLPKHRTTPGSAREA